MGARISKREHLLWRKDDGIMFKSDEDAAKMNKIQGEGPKEEI